MTYCNPTREEKIAYLWDFGKYLYGVRPRWVNFRAMSHAELDALAKRWNEEMEDQEDQRRHQDELDAEFRRLESMYGDDDHICDFVAVRGGVYCRHCGSDM